MRERGRQYELVSKDLYPEIVERYQGGETQTSIALGLGVDRTTIGVILRGLGVPKYEQPVKHNVARYTHGCRCEECVRAVRIYTREKRWAAGMRPRAGTLEAHAADLSETRL